MKKFNYDQETLVNAAEDKKKTKLTWKIILGVIRLMYFVWRLLTFFF